MFPVPISQKTDIHTYACKLFENATICVKYENEKIVSAVFGYTDNVVNEMGYISAVATLPSARGKKYASTLVKEFIGIARSKRLKAVHLYAKEENVFAIKMYERLGFVTYKVADERRPDDVHLIKFI